MIVAGLRNGRFVRGVRLSFCGCAVCIAKSPAADSPPKMTDPRGPSPFISPFLRGPVEKVRMAFGSRRKHSVSGACSGSHATWLLSTKQPAGDALISRIPCRS